VIRSLATILAALNVAAPGLPNKPAVADTLQEFGEKYHYDPLTMVAVVENESRWQTGAISSDGSYGLAQIRAVNFEDCRADPDGIDCTWWKTALLGWRMNLMIASGYFAASREHCKKTVGTGLATYWLQAFQGFDDTRKTTCGHVRRGKRWAALPVPELTRKILARRKELAALRPDVERAVVKL
jgi:Transglycosylase SLT domain